MSHNPLRELSRLGQSAWLDFISRTLIISGELDKLVQEDLLGGVTSNPSIFMSVIAKTDDYNQEIKHAHSSGLVKPKDIYESLAIKDIKDAADILLPTYERLHANDGYVSLEVSPHLAHDTNMTIQEAQSLWARVDRPNLMIKVPGTKAGCKAIEELIYQGININVTLLFSTSAYEQAAKAYIAGMRARIRDGLDISRVHSVASFFISRIDNKIDGLLASINTKQALSLMGKIAIANAKHAYEIFTELFEHEKIHPQRLLWASTSTKNPNYPDVIYVEELIGPHTVNTMPMTTLKAFRDHGQAQNTLVANLEQARYQRASLKALGIDLDQVCDELLTDGLKLFCDSFDELLASPKFVI